LENAVRCVEQGDYDVVVPALGRGDEIGGIAQRLDHFKDELALAKRAEQSKGQVVEELGKSLKCLAAGDLKVKIETEFPTEYDQLKEDFNAATISLDKAISVVNGNVVSLRSETSNITVAADELAHRTERQAATLEETAAALDQLTTSVRNATAGADQASEMSEQAQKNAEVGGVVAREAVTAMGEIKASSKEISKITLVIDDIAFQTNLLAFNAGVEAARAGEAGRGFAVVATEVRALAQRSSEAASEINALISASGKHVNRGVELVDKTGVALDSIVVSVADISKRVVAIAASAREQATGLSEINEAVMELDHVTQQNAAMFDKTTAANHALMQETRALAEAVDIFKLSGEVTLPLSLVKLHDSSSTMVKAAGSVGIQSQDAPRSVNLGEWDEF
jgi:methyl-accepting chemotaxis protein